MITEEGEIYYEVDDDDEVKLENTINPQQQQEQQGYMYDQNDQSESLTSQSQHQSVDGVVGDHQNKINQQEYNNDKENNCDKSQVQEQQAPPQQQTNFEQVTQAPEQPKKQGFFSSLFGNCKELKRSTARVSDEDLSKIRQERYIREVSRDEEKLERKQKELFAEHLAKNDVFREAFEEVFPLKSALKNSNQVQQPSEVIAPAPIKKNKKKQQVNESTIMSNGIQFVQTSVINKEARAEALRQKQLQEEQSQQQQQFSQQQLQEQASLSQSRVQPEHKKYLNYQQQNQRDNSPERDRDFTTKQYQSNYQYNTPQNLPLRQQPVFLQQQIDSALNYEDLMQRKESESRVKIGSSRYTSAPPPKSESLRFTKMPFDVKLSQALVKMQPSLPPPITQNVKADPAKLQEFIQAAQNQSNTQMQTVQDTVNKLQQYLPLLETPALLPAQPYIQEIFQTLQKLKPNEIISYEMALSVQKFEELINALQPAEVELKVKERKDLLGCKLKQYEDSQQ